MIGYWLIAVFVLYIWQIYWVCVWVLLGVGKAQKYTRFRNMCSRTVVLYKVTGNFREYRFPDYHYTTQPPDHISHLPSTSPVPQPPATPCTHITTNTITNHTLHTHTHTITSPPSLGSSSSSSSPSGPLRFVVACKPQASVGAALLV